MKGFFLSILAFAALNTHGQTVFLEVFDEAANAVVGSDAIGPTAWTAICPNSGAATDYLKVVANALEARDTNGPAIWESNDFDISACTDGITISVDITETGTAEPVTCGGSCNLGDGIKFEVSYDGGTSWTAYSDAVNGFVGTCVVMSGCGTTDCQGCGPCGSNAACDLSNYPVPWGAGSISGPFIGTDDFTSSSFSDCASVGISSTMRFRLTFLCWSGTEYLGADNVSAVCSSCALPVEVGMFEAQRLSDRSIINWRTLSESNNKKFRIQRSTDGFLFQTIGEARGQINSTQTVDYEFIDENPIDQEIVYYRLEQVDLNGKMKYSDVRKVHYQPTEIYYTGTDISINFPKAPNQAYTVNIYDLSGALIYTQKIAERTSIPWDKKGFYIIEIPELEQRQKLVTQ